MNTLKQLFKIEDNAAINKVLRAVCICLIMCLLWQTLPGVLMKINPTVGLIDNGVWQLLLFTVVCFIVLTLCCMLLFRWFLENFGLPRFHEMVLLFNKLTLWQQSRLYLALFALLFLGALLSLMAIF